MTPSSLAVFGISSMGVTVASNIRGPIVRHLDYQGWGRSKRSGRWLNREDVITALEWISQQDVTGLDGAEVLRLAADSIRQTTSQ